MFSLVPGSNVALTVEGLCKTCGKTVAVGPLSFSLTVGSTTGLLGGAAIAAGALIGGVLLWDILLRDQQGFSFSFSKRCGRATSPIC